ncbi:MAG: peptidase [Bdellovibrionaceae bacterium]|nr:peptidase [Pseudobdellovibrionaceae bacterium]MDW8189407.1 peptidase [Pseudobdellovibrionaceae bacterium]
MKKSNVTRLPRLKSRKKRVTLRRPKKSKQEIVIDASLGLVFSSEEEILNYFEAYITFLTKSYQELQDKNEVPLENIGDLEDKVNQSIEDPDEVWMLPELPIELHGKKIPVFSFIRWYDNENYFHVLLTHVDANDEPTFIYYQFFTRDRNIVEHFRRGRMVYDQTLHSLEFAMIDGDALSEGDPLAVGLFNAMLKLRSANDVPFDKFKELGEQCRDITIESADEIWRVQDSSGNILVTFIRDFPDHGIKDLHYIVVTQQDVSSGVYGLLFSFPTNDLNLVERYRHGENLEADDINQESAH